MTSPNEPGKSRRPGRRTRATKATAGSASSVTLPDDTDIAADLRRRRAASDRLPPLGDGSGRRDPMDSVPEQRNQWLHITIDRHRNVALVRGWGAKAVVERSGHRPLWSASGQGWCVDARHAPDVEACCQLMRVGVTVREVGAA